MSQDALGRVRTPQDASCGLSAGAKTGRKLSHKKRSFGPGPGLGPTAIAGPGPKLES